MTNSVKFYLNGKQVTIDNPSPDLLLIDYLRSPDVALVGPKKPCGQGGCGGCTVILSEWNEKTKKPEHRAINSCLRPVCALDGLTVTTVEGTGAARPPQSEHMLHRPSATRAGASHEHLYSPVLEEAKVRAEEKRQQVKEAVEKGVNAKVKNSNLLAVVKNVATNPSEHSNEGMNPVAYRLAMNNGSQCGYCSVGFVMNMSEFITNNPNATKKEIEQAFDGNLCRCTGYRSILTGMKTFASDWTKSDEAQRMKCKTDYVAQAQLPAHVSIPFPKGAEHPPSGINSGGWSTPNTLDELGALMLENDKTRMVHGNTSFGVYKDEYMEARHFADIRFIPELNGSNKVEGHTMTVYAGTSYSDFLDLVQSTMARLQQNTEKYQKYGISVLNALDYMGRRTAGRILRNAASLGGNTMLVLKHIPIGTGEPFPSDLFTALCAVDAKITYYLLEKNGKFKQITHSAQELSEYAHADASLADRIVLGHYSIPLGHADSAVLAQKVALREVNSHSIVNATSMIEFSGKTKVKSVAFVLGGIAPFPWRPKKTEKAMTGKELTVEEADKLAQLLAREVGAELVQWQARMKEVPDEGFTAEYRIQLAVSFFYKAVVNALIVRGAKVPKNLQSSGEIQWGNWQVSDGVQYYEPQDYKAPVAQPYIKNIAMYQTSGQTQYTHELPVPPRTLNGAMVQSTQALMNYYFIHPESKKKISESELRAYLTEKHPEFRDLITYQNIKKGGVNLQGMGMDQPLFAESLISYVGQTIAMVLCDGELHAQNLALYIGNNCVGYAAPGSPWTGIWKNPIFDLLDAIRIGSIYPDAPTAATYVSHIWKITRPGSNFDWSSMGKTTYPYTLMRDKSIKVRETRVDNVPCTVVGSSQLCGGQVHFYMEPQACIATPINEGRVRVQPSVQSPAAMHDTVKMALGVHYNQVEIDIPVVGGGFGGKTEQTRFIAGPTAVAAQATKRPVRLVMPRDEDTAMIGKRHGYYGEYEIAVDNGEVKKENKGIILGLKMKLWGDGGAFYDCSFIVSNCVQLRTDNAYMIRNFQSEIDVCRTNTAPSTAMRAFGDVQGKNILENAIDDAATSIQMRAEELREKNLYNIGDVTPFGQALSYCYMRQVWSYAKEKSQFDQKCRDVEKFNRENKWRKRGISMIPVKYGSGYNLLALEQAAAIVVVNPADGSVVIHQGGVEIGQGLTTQAQQVAAYVLGIPMDMIFIDNVKTSITPKPTSTGGSTGTPYSAEAVKQTCEVMRTRLMEFGYQVLKEKGEEWCVQNGIDFWNYGAGQHGGWATKVKTAAGTSMIWQNLTNLASNERVDLVASFNAKIKGGEVQIPSMTFKPMDEQPDIPGIKRDKDAQLGGGVDSFVGFTYSAACSVAEVDILTGEVKIISSDIVYDMGYSMNPAIDIGQVEGAFVQGIGYLMTEKLVTEPDGPHKGRLNTTNTWRYKIPAITTIPLEMNTYLFPRGDKSVASIPLDSNEIFSAKEVGEPPLVLANSVFFAIKSAIRASREERKLPQLFQFDAPATVQEVRKACDVSIKELS